VIDLFAILALQDSIAVGRGVQGRAYKGVMGLFRSAGDVSGITQLLSCLHDVLTARGEAPNMVATMLPSDANIANALNVAAAKTVGGRGHGLFQCGEVHPMLPPRCKGQGGRH